MDNLEQYYARRAAEYERIYAKPERQADLYATDPPQTYPMIHCHCFSKSAASEQDILEVSTRHFTASFFNTIQTSSFF